MELAYYLHLLGTAVWVGGLIVIAATIPAVRRVTEERAVIAAIARRFGVVSWAAMALLVVTGLILLAGQSWTGLLLVKAALVLASILLASWHTLGARTHPPSTRALLQSTILLLALVILGLAVAL